MAASSSALATPAEIKEFNTDTNLGKIYKIKKARGVPDTSFYTHILGCQDNGIENQKLVETLRRQIIDDTKQEPDYLILLGDMGKPGGFKSQKDFEENYYSISLDRRKAAFGAMGNHEHGYPKISKAHFENFPYVPFPKRVVGVDNDLINANYVVMHTYLGADGNLDPLKVERFAQDTLYLNELEGLIFPARYYGLYREIDNTVELYIDSNTYMDEWNRFKNGDSKMPNQAIWLEKTVAEYKARGIEVELYQHNPLQPNGKRANKGYVDSDENLSAVAIKQIGTLLEKTDVSSYSSMLRDAYSTTSILDACTFVACAHEHGASHALLAKPHAPGYFVQAVIGNGGGSLEPRYRYDADTVLHSGRFGFATRNGRTTTYYTLPAPELHPLGHRIAIRDNERAPCKIAPDAAGVYELHAIFKLAFEQYLKNNPLKPTWLPVLCWDYSVSGKLVSDMVMTYKPISGESENAFYGNDIANYFLRSESNTLLETIHYLTQAFSKAPLLQNAFKKEFFNHYSKEFNCFLDLSADLQVDFLQHYAKFEIVEAPIKAASESKMVPIAEATESLRSAETPSTTSSPSSWIPWNWFSSSSVSATGEKVGPALPRATRALHIETEELGIPLSDAITVPAVVVTPTPTPEFAGKFFSPNRARALTLAPSETTHHSVVALSCRS